MTTEPVISGKAESGEMVCGPGPGTLKTMSSAPGLALALRIACLSEPAPLSLVLVTVKVAAKIGKAAASGRLHSVRHGGTRRKR